MLDRVLKAAACLCGVAGLYHLAAVLLPGVGIRGSVVRHIAFVFIDLACAILLVRRPRWFALAFACLTIQQLLGHGRRAWATWEQASQLDWISLGVLVLMPVVLAMLVFEARHQREKGGRRTRR